MVLVWSENQISGPVRNVRANMARIKKRQKNIAHISTWNFSPEQEWLQARDGTSPKFLSPSRARALKVELRSNLSLSDTPFEPVSSQVFMQILGSSQASSLETKLGRAFYYQARAFPSLGQINYEPNLRARAQARSTSTQS